MYGRWESTGELVSEIDANFHVPWYSTGQCHNNDANCLNLDHTDYIPIIYGLSSEFKDNFYDYRYKFRNYIIRQSALTV